MKVELIIAKKGRMKKLKILYNRVTGYLSENYFLIHVISIYIYSRIIYYFVFRILFNDGTLNFAIQYLDPKLLKNNLLQSLLYLHSQPPLFNFYLGMGIKLFPASMIYFFHYSFLLMGLIFTVSFYELMVKLNISKKISFFTTVIFILSPASILYENLLFYTYPLMVLLVLSALFLANYLIGRSFFHLYAFFATLLVISLMQSFFNLFWFLSIVFFIMLYQCEDRKRIIYTAAIPMVLIFSVYLKNYIIFGEFTDSTWLGMNISRITTFQIDKSTRDSLYKAGDFSYYATLSDFPHINNKLNKIALDSVGLDIPAIDKINKSTNTTNYNSINYIKISNSSLNDAFFILRKIPSYYFKGVKNAALIFFTSPTSYKLLENNKVRIQGWDKIFDKIFYWQFWGDTSPGLLIIILYFSSLIYGCFMLFSNQNPEKKIIIAYLLFNIIYTTIVGNLLEVGENNRFRYVIDPFIWIMAGMLINQIFNRGTVRNHESIHNRKG